MEMDYKDTLNLPKTSFFNEGKSGPKGTGDA